MNIPAEKLPPSLVPIPIVGRLVCILSGPVGPVGAEGILLGGTLPILLGTFTILLSFPSVLGISLANLPTTKYLVLSKLQKKLTHDIFKVIFYRFICKYLPIFPRTFNL